MLNITPEFQHACFWITVYPIFWTVISRLEYYTGLVSKIFCGPRVAVILLASGIEILNVIRTVTFQAALDSYPKMIRLDNNFAYGLGLCCLTVGMVLVLSSYWRLGFFGTFYGDYFGLLTEGGPVTSFPYTVTDNPMYCTGAVL